MLEEHQHLPNTDRLSVLAASILLAYALLPFIQLPERNLIFNVLGVAFVFKINFSTVTAVLSAALAAAGTSWLLMDHPYIVREGGQGRGLFQHWLLPALTAWVIGVPLHSLNMGIQWWGVFSFGGVLLVAVLVSEYIAVDPNDTRHGPATIGLTAVSYALFLILTIALAAAGTRLYVLLPGLGISLFLLTMRNLYLRLGSWCWNWSAGITLAVVQIAAALHYWRLTSLSFGLLVLGLVYALASVAGSLEEGRSMRSSWLEPAIMLIVLWGLAFALNG